MKKNDIDRLFSADGFALLSYPIKEFDFAAIIKKWFDVDDLTKIHEDGQYEEIFSKEEDQKTHWHKIFYEKNEQDPSFNNLYKKFLEEAIKPTRRGGRIVYQRSPTFRVHLCGNVAVGDWHRDKDYRDKDWHEKVKEKNFYLPLTETNEENTIWAETEEDKEDYSPFLLEYGEYGECLEWDAKNLKHGNKVNNSGKTRVSVDFRVIDEENYVASDQTSIDAKFPFAIRDKDCPNGYYDIM